MMTIAPLQPDNPTDYQRHQLVKYTLKEENRLEDYPYIMKSLSPPKEITTIGKPGEFKNIKVGIIGGGVAGLSAAFELRKLGFNITIFEANKDRIGGRIYTYHFDKEKGLYGELGAMRVPSSHNVTWHYINHFNLKTRPFVQQNKNALIYAKNIRVKNDPNGLNVMEKIYPKFNLRPWERRIPWMDLQNYAYNFPIFSMPPNIRVELSKILQSYSPIINYWDYYSNRQLLEMMGLSQSAIMMLSSVSSFGSSFFYYSTTDFLHEIYTVAFSNLYEIVGGMYNLPLSFYNSLTSKTPKEYSSIPAHLLGDVSWRGGTSVNGIFYNYKNHKVTLRYSEVNSDDNYKESFDYIVCAIPFSILRTLEIYPQFSNKKMQAIRELSYAAAQKSLFLCKERFWEQGGPNKEIKGGSSYTDLPNLSIWYPSDFKEKKQKGVIIASYNFTSDALRLGNIPPPLRFRKIKNQVAQVHGLPMEYLNNVVEDYKSLQWYNNPLSLGAFSFFRPEQKKLFSFAVTQPEYNNKIFFAGEHISLAHAWISGSFSTGMKAANAIAERAKLQNK